MAASVPQTDLFVGVRFSSFPSCTKKFFFTKSTVTKTKHILNLFSFFFFFFCSVYLVGVGLNIAKFFQFDSMFFSYFFPTMNVCCKNGQKEAGPYKPKNKLTAGDYSNIRSQSLLTKNLYGENLVLLKKGKSAHAAVCVFRVILYTTHFFSFVWYNVGGRREGLIKFQFPIGYIVREFRDAGERMRL